MSIGELTSLYRSGELVIRPEFQRLFRWSPLQKSRLVESILLGIPLPSIFVSQTDDGKWELVDGLQRVSTILQLQGELRDENGNVVEALQLEPTIFLPALEGKKWKGLSAQDTLSEAQKLDIKRAKIDIKIIKRESSPQAKYDLFNRLNSYGSPLTAQELRSSLLVAVSPEFFQTIQALAEYPSFAECITMNERLFEERFDLEVITRFLVLHNWPESRINRSSLRDLPTVLDNEIINIANKSRARRKILEQTFKTTFDFIAEHGGADVFTRWDASKNRFSGPFLNSAFEIFGLGVGFHVANNSRPRTDLIKAAREVWAEPFMRKGFATGRSTEERLTQFIPLGRKVTAGK